ncbi:hypothetical protein RND81_08G084300 [Saponaria officinalis]|uniref:BURP domain-containing protein n=1 Tax=Saponaria officinalis TaxID=3572 RepID=A0AAW1J5J5_SAPOF
MNVGNDVTMPKVVKDALLGSQGNKSDNNAVKTGGASQNFDKNVARVYVQQLSRARSNRATKAYNNNAVQAYAQQLSRTKTNFAAKVYDKNAVQAYVQHLSGTKTNLAAKVYDTNADHAAQAYAQQLSQTKTNLAAKVYDKNVAEAYAQKLSKTKSNLAAKVHDYTVPQAYAQRLSGTKSNLAAKVYDTKGSKLPTDNSMTFFFEKNLVHPGSRMKLHFLMGAQEAKFMPTQLANSIPFSSTKLPQILKFFDVNHKSKNANIIEETITICESKPIKGEAKPCETSLESMVNYVKSHLGKQVKALSTEINKETKQDYTIESAQKINNNEKNLVCHKMVYPYAVFYCHTLSKTDAYQVSLIDTHGKKVRAVAVCHKDTSPWNEGHIAFQLLKVKPGGAPICHFLDADTMIWVPK